MANRKHVRVVRQGAEAIAQWREEHPGVRLELQGANLAGAVRRRPALRGVDPQGEWEVVCPAYVRRERERVAAEADDAGDDDCGAAGTLG